MTTPPKQRTTKNARLEFRVPGAQKELIEDAHLQGVSVSDFLAAAHREAVRVIQDSASMVLNRDESARFAQALLNPAPPTAALHKLMRDE